MLLYRYNEHKIDIKHNHPLKYKYLNSEINLLFSYLFPRKMKIYALAGLLTYSIFKHPSHSIMNSGMGFV